MKITAWASVVLLGTVVSLSSLRLLHASNDMTLQSILDEWAEAVGGRDRLASIELQHRTGTATMYGMDGTTEEWRARDGRYHVELVLASVFGITIINDGSDYWLLDQNKKVSRQAGHDLESLITTAYFDTWQHLLGNPADARASYEGIDPSSGHHVVQFHPKGGVEARVFLDAATFLPVHTVTPSHSGENTTTTFHDWQMTDGVRYPQTTLVSDGTPQNDQRYETVEVRFTDVSPTGIFNKPGESDTNISFASGHAALDIPIDLDGVHIFTQVRLNGSEPLWFVLDTGASVTAVDTKLAEEKGFELSGKVMAGGAGANKTEVNFIQDASFALPGLEVSGQTVAAAQLGAILEPRVGRPVDGILGYDLISRFVVEIDYFNERMHLYERTSYEYSGNGEIVPIRLVGGTPHCEITLVVPGRDPIECTVVVDTGSGNAMTFTKPFTESHDLLSVPAKTAMHTGGLGIGGETKKIIGRMPELRIGNLQFKQLVCGFSRDEKGTGADATIAGLVGGRLLEQCTVIFDYGRQQMILEPNERYGNTIELGMSGLTFTTEGRANWHKFTVLHVMEKSPGARAGIEAGDVIVEIDGRPATEFYARDLTKMFRDNGRTIRLIVQRNGKAKEKKLKLKPIV